MKTTLCLFVVLCAITLSAQQKKPVEKSTVRFVNPDGLEKNPRYTHLVEIRGGHVVLISGQVATDKSGNVVGQGDFRAQVTQVFENIKSALASVGATFDDVVKINSFIVDMPTNLPAYRDVRGQYLSKNAHPPASTTVGTPALVRPELLLEVEVTAVIPEKKK